MSENELTVGMNKRETLDYDTIVEEGIATPEEINLVFNCCCKGWEYTFNSIVKVRTGYESLKDYMLYSAEE